MCQIRGLCQIKNYFSRILQIPGFQTENLFLCANFGCNLSGHADGAAKRASFLNTRQAESTVDHPFWRNK
jgi:hypothetical protein